MSRLNLFAKPLVRPRHILLTGASGGLGYALAQHYAASGVHLTLWGRSTERLERISKICRDFGSTVSHQAFSLTDLDLAVQTLRSVDAERPIDMLILNAGVSDIRATGDTAESVASVVDTALVNFAAPVALATQASHAMAQRRRGRIVFLGSVAAHHDLPFAAAYSGSKAGLARFATALHAALAPYNVGVTLIEPGFVDTPMSRRLEGLKPFIVSAEKMAQCIVESARDQKTVVIYPRVFIALKLLSALLPRPLAHRILRTIRVRQRTR